MTIDVQFAHKLQAVFEPLNTVAAARAFPRPLSLATALEAAMPRAAEGSTNVNPSISALFATAAVEAWQRGIHSFLISSSLTDASPLWAVVSGYYSSHYCVRAFAHLLGFFQLHQRKRVVHLESQHGRFVCTYVNKQREDREHKFYWKTVKRDRHFQGDPLFTDNHSDPSIEESDAGHRERANYADHHGQFPAFRPLDAEQLRNRIQHISQIEFATPPIPRRSAYPDIEAVQVVAYHRIVKFRCFLDEILGGKNRFWTVQRNPGWTHGFIDFQLTEQGGLTALRN
jgi:hypothetical protein